MNRSRIAVAVIVVAALAVFGFQIADPLDGPPTAPKLDYDGPANELAADALMQIRARDHVRERRLFVTGESGSQRIDHRTLVRFDVTDRQIIRRKIEPEYDIQSRIFINENGIWTPRSGSLHPYEFFIAENRFRIYSSRFLSVSHLRTSPGVTKTVGEETATITVTDTTAAFAVYWGMPETDSDSSLGPDFRANLTIVIDRKADAPRRIVYRSISRSDENESRLEQTRIISEFRNWDDVDVRRPESIGYSLAELRADLRR